jgi:chromosome partitioning protein
MDVLRGTAIAEVLLKTADGIDLLPARIDLAGADQLLASRPGREFVVRDSLAALANNYDWMIIDCSPSLGIITINALAAADEVIIPLQCETLSHRGVGQHDSDVARHRRVLERLRPLVRRYG